MQISNQIASKNYDLRPQNDQSIRYIILHYTKLNFEDTVSKFCDQKSKLSSHYLIKKDGSIFRLVEDCNRAWHAGKSRWKNEEAINNNSIGIEIENSGKEEFATDQMISVISLCKSLMNKYAIKADHVLGHSDIAPNRKIDPGVYFDWATLAKKDIGITFSPIILAQSEPKILSNDQLIQVQKKLKKIGYDIEVSGIMDQQTSDVFRAFHLHFSRSSIISQGGLDNLFDRKTTYEWTKESDRILSLLTS